MAFSNSSYFAGVGTVCAALTLGFAVGAMMTTGGVQPPNRLERVTSSATLPSSTVERSTAPMPPLQQPPTAAVAVSTPVSDSPRVQQAPPAPPVMAKSEDTAAPNVQPPLAAPQIMAKSEDAATAKNERASVRSADLKREATRKRSEETKLAERKRQEIEDAANAVRQMRRDGVIDQVIERDPAPRFGFFGND